MASLHTYSAAELVPAFRADLAVELPVTLADGSYAAGTVLGVVTASGKYAAYDADNSDGTETAAALLRYACTVASGKITIGGDHGESVATAPAYFAGYFNAADLTGMDAAGLADLSGRLVRGDISTGLVRIF